MKTFEKDRVFIDNKYHKTDEPFDPYERRATHGWEDDPATGLSDEELLEGLRELSRAQEGVPHPVAKARAMAYVLENIRIDVNEHDWFVDFYSRNRLIRETTQNKWNEELFQQIIPEVGEKMSKFHNSGAVAIWPDYDHVVPDWKSLMALGFPGILQRARDYRLLHEQNGTMTEDKAAYFDSIEIVYTAIIDVLDRLYQYALTKNHGKAAEIAQCMMHLRDGAPQNTYDALQMIYVYFIISDMIDTYQVRSLGSGLDNTLYSFYVRDLEAGTYTREEVREFIAYFLEQWAAIGNIMGQPMYLAGTNPDGSTRVNELSYMILDVYDELGIYDPKIQIKVNRNTPDAFLNKIFDMIRRGHNSLVLCCEPGMIKAVMSYGATYEEALDMDIRGCFETGVRANEVSTSTGYVNALKALEYVFSNGYDVLAKQQIGLETGELSSFKTFEDFYSAVLKQWTYFMECTIEMANAYEKYLSFVNPSPMYSATIVGSLEKGFDAYQGGVKFNNSAMLNCSFACFVDGIVAVKEFVYDKKEVSLQTLKEALDADWVGYEWLRQKIKKSPHKYGNGDPLADRYAEALARYFAVKVNNRPNARGGIYKTTTHSAMEFIWQGELTLATPDGRKAGEEGSRNSAPASGMDRNGVTALIQSALRLTPSLYWESFCLDVMLHPSAVSGDEGLTVLKSLLGVYMDQGGMSIQFNIFDAETLRDAQKHPEKYQNLQVRVTGWNVLWNNLTKKEQDSYIIRCENIQ